MGFDIDQFFASLPEGLTPGEIRSLVPWGLWRAEPLKAAILALQRSGKIDEEDYLTRYPDVKESGLNAIEHYLKFGKNEQRSLFIKNCEVQLTKKINTLPKDNKNIKKETKTNSPFQHLPIPIENIEELVQSELWKTDPVKALIMALKRSGEIDEEDYLDRYADVRVNGINAIEHYITNGWKEKRRIMTLEETRIRKQSQEVVKSKNANQIERGGKIGIIIINRNGAKLLDRLFASVHRYPPDTPYKIFVTDHNSSDESKLILKKWQKVLDITINYGQKNYTFSYSNNRWAEKITDCEKLLFLNNDIFFTSNVIDEMAKELDNPETGIVGIDQIQYHIDEEQKKWHHLGISFHWDKQFQFWRPYNITNIEELKKKEKRNLPAVTASLMMIKTKEFLAVDGFDESYEYGYEDIDLCLKIQTILHKRIICLPSINVFHADGATRNKITQSELSRMRSGNIKRLKSKFTRIITRLMRRSITEEIYDLNRQIKVGFIVTEKGEESAAGDYFTAMEFGEALQEEFGWIINFYCATDIGACDLSDRDIIISMLEEFDARNLKSVNPAAIKIGWGRNWFDKWAKNIWREEYDFLLASSKQSADFFTEQTGQIPMVLRIATNKKNFLITNNTKKRELDFAFTGSYWWYKRDILDALPKIPESLNGAIYGKNWSRFPFLKKWYRGFINYSDIFNVYKNTKIVIDDANHVTKKWGSTNSRVFDAIAAGCLVITNSKLASEDTFESILPVYEKPEDLPVLLQENLRDAKKRETYIHKLRQIVENEHTYTNRAYQFLEQLRNYNHLSFRFAIKIPVPNCKVAQTGGGLSCRPGSSLGIEKTRP